MGQQVNPAKARCVSDTIPTHVVPCGEAASAVRTSAISVLVRLGNQCASSIGKLYGNQTVRLSLNVSLLGVNRLGCSAPLVMAKAAVKGSRMEGNVTTSENDTARLQHWPQRLHVGW